MIEAIVKFQLSYPFKKSVSIIHDLVITWNLRLISSSTSSDIAVVKMHWKKFKAIFGHNPRLGEVEVPVKLQKFIHNIKVEKLVVTDEK